MKGGRKLSQWNLFVKKIYQEGKAKNSKYDFKQALTDASSRKSEMGSSGSSLKQSGKKSKRYTKTRKAFASKTKKYRKR